jgi:hypothetical protein
MMRSPAPSTRHSSVAKAISNAGAARIHQGFRREGVSFDSIVDLETHFPSEN